MVKPNGSAYGKKSVIFDADIHLYDKCLVLT